MEAECLLKNLLYLNLNISRTKIGRNKLDLISSFLSKRWLLVVLDRKPSQEYPANAVFPQGSILGPTFFLLYLNDLPDNDLSVILLSMLMILFSTLNVIRHLVLGNNQNRLLNLNLTYETLRTGAESDLLISMLEKLNQFCSTRLIRLVLFM